MRPKMHASGVKPYEERLVILRCALNKLLGAVEELKIDRLHALFVERSGIRYATVGKAVDDSAGPKALTKSRGLGVVRILRFLLGIQVVEVAEELVKTVLGGQELVAVP